MDISDKSNRLFNARTADDCKLKTAHYCFLKNRSDISVKEYRSKVKHAKLNDWGYFDAGEDCKTHTEGLFVAGDCRSKQIRQVVTASSDGAIAAMAACRYVD